MTSISWKGYDWTLNDAVGAYYDYSENNVTVDSNGYLNLAVTNPAGDHPICAEAIGTAQLGYGTYRIVVETDLTTMHKNIVFSLWSQNSGTYYTNYFTEFDFPEISKWDVYANVLIYHNAWYHNKVLMNNSETLPTGMQTHIFIWSPNQAVFKSYLGNVAIDTQETPYFETSYNKNVPIPTNTVPRIITWCYKDGDDADDKTVTPITIVVRDFEFKELSNTAAQKEIRGIAHG